MNRVIAVWILSSGICVASIAQRPSDLPSSVNLGDSWHRSADQPLTQTLPRGTCTVAITNLTGSTLNYKWAVSRNDPFTGHNFYPIRWHDEVAPEKKGFKCLHGDADESGDIYVKMESKDKYSVLAEGLHYSLEAETRYAFFYNKTCSCSDLGRVPALK